MRPDKFRKLRAPAMSLAAVTVLMAPPAGCVLPPAKSSALPTQVDRLMQTYPELHSGRLLVIADFEDPKHLGIFQLASVSPDARMVLDNKKGREETGRGCLRFTAGAPGDKVVVSNTGASQWYLKRDWRPYDLLLMSLHSAAPDLSAEVSISGGPPADRQTTEASFLMHKGWNVVRLDLAEIGERIPLDDVQEISLSVAPVAKPTELVLDDVLLTAYREDLLGDSQHRDAGLYVQRVGRRWKIGAAGPTSDFELTFANGQIVELFDLASDPYRIHNLVRGTTLGPSPVVVGSTDKEASDFSFFGKVVVASSRIIELNPVRVVISSEWRFVEDSKAAQASLDDRPFQRWLYTIYPTGQIYVGVESTAKTEAWSPRLGLAATVALLPGLETAVYEDSGSGETAGPPFVYATARNKEPDVLLLYTLHDPGRSARMTETTPRLGSEAELVPEPERISFLATSDQGEEKVARWVSHILIASASKVDDDELRARAVRYAAPVAPKMEVGALAALPNGRSESPGFDPESGCHLIVPDRGYARFVVDGRQQRWFSPVFRIIAPDNRDAAVYVNHLIHERVARDRDGNLVFQLDGCVSGQVLVEVLFRRSERPSGT